ncbi:hypothetical protein [Hydrogenophaga sp.]|uniref:hypothetical protein n=1 Tax=Hydrogenophaga sp. TaxID=1904254 RepID=UPI002733B20B|nr:hypothetical protein [Hydrogenophaga sp.]MDP3108669.1 hypothetical protein [Hydrogenophaga sp.]
MSSQFVRVPFYIESNGDKTHFLPSCRTSKGYRIGSKGDEQLIEDYWEALRLVMEMQVRRFRRPNSKGNFGIVKCETENVEEVSHAKIEEQIAAPDSSKSTAND